MARLSPHGVTTSNDESDEIPLEDIEIARGNDHGADTEEQGARRLTFDPRDLEDLEGLETDEQVGDLNLQEFVKLASKDAKLLYKSIDKLKKSCERKLQTKDDALSALIDERDELQQVLERMTIRFTNMTDSGAAPSSYKGPKIPDGKKLRDGSNPRYESWKTDVRGKLRAMKHQFNTPEARILYVKSMCEGDAADHLMARMRDDAADPYLDSDDMFEHLGTVYLDANREIKAKTEFRQLVQKTMRFQTFLSKFNLLALDAKKARSKWKEELYHKLNLEMKRAMIREAKDPACQYNDFVKECNLVANRLEQNAKEEKSSAKEAKDAKDGKASKDDKTNKSSTGQGGGKSAAKAPRVHLSEEEKERLKKEQLYFNCKQPGHINRNCPLRKKPIVDVKSVEESETAVVNQGNDEA
ncbi:conserved hypothetical protein [Talaromyces stipitatus ATCC 10500]|uniref:CCHC-type domain-containing protein n=1 Tax=Talaromyces stipitatus (strain ATCC 10500 / CBS 375.48 / QM 6759 / NRRL 1006) TaxID=441959 RepID=B8MI87_TALSN|nr:uncharacterized protein TSTA_040510 [Talaromyces stipitatus ATCC 10500]EED14571.1 conserved hypothetical protein [Talaromyces stipitatus ATCC 10500]